VLFLPEPGYIISCLYLTLENIFSCPFMNLDIIFFLFNPGYILLLPPEPDFILLFITEPGYI